ncbi:MAG: SRPBCC family protein [Bdellovibrionaceae bacterium]|nr:SRPBCC family protein [Pseudobdellovibrionaceae bacterium]
MPGTQHTEVFNCSPDEFWAIVTDYEKYPEFIGEVKECRILKSDGNRKLVEFKVSVIKSFTYTLWMNETPKSVVSWEFGGGDIFKSQTGSWKLQEEAGRTRATYTVDATFSLFVPGPVAKTLLTVNLPSMMSAYHKRVKDLYGK